MYEEADMAAKNRIETLLNCVEQVRRNFANKVIGVVVVALPLLVFFPAKSGAIEEAEGDAPVVISRMAFEANRVPATDATLSYRADFEIIKGDAVATVTEGNTTLLVRLNVPQTGFEKAELKCPSCSIKPISLVPGLNVIEKNVKALRKGLITDKVYIVVKTTADEGEEVLFHPVRPSSR